MSAKPRPARLAAIIVGVVVALLVALLATRSVGTRDKDSFPIEGEVAPPINGKVVRGQPFDITTSDQWVVVNFFATWCPPCVQEHPELVAFAEEHDRIGDARVISVVYNDRQSKIDQFFETRGGNWTVFDADKGRTAFAWGVTGVPESYVVSPSGVVVERLRGGVTQDALNQIINAYATAPEATSTTTGGAGS